MVIAIPPSGLSAPIQRRSKPSSPTEPSSSETSMTNDPSDKNLKRNQIELTEYNC